MCRLLMRVLNDPWFTLGEPVLCVVEGPVLGPSFVRINSVKGLWVTG